MTNEELVEAYQQGDSKALNELLENNCKIVYKLANRFKNNGINSEFVEDLIQEGLWGLMIAAQKYDFNYENKATFITYAVYYINQRILRYYNNNKDRKKEYGLNDFVLDKSGKEHELLDTIADETDYEENAVDSIYNQDLNRDIYRSMGKVNTLFEREVLELNYGLNNKDSMELKEIASLLQTTYGKVNQTKGRALRKLRHSPIILKYKEYYIQEGRPNFSFWDNLKLWS